jgi:spindle pole body formation-associated protein
MLSWITGSKDTLLEPDNGKVGLTIFMTSADNKRTGGSFIEPPETPAPVFVVKAFKQALFGTPQATTPAPPTFKQTNNSVENVLLSKSSQHRQAQPSNTHANKEIGDPDTDTKKFDVVEFLQNESPAKPNGILMTPGTVPGRRKQVTFGAHVVNNEGKTTKYSKSGLPDDCPGKFPSPFTPKTAAPPANKLQKAMASVKQNVSQNKSESIKTKAFEGKKEITQSTARSKDDSDITSDMNFPASSSGRYWKDQYEAYAARSESEMKRLIAKHKLAKDYARMKDEESTTFQTRLEYDRKKHKELEKSMENQLKDMRERLRITMAENSKLKMEIALMRQSCEELVAKSNADTQPAVITDIQHSHVSQKSSKKPVAKIPQLKPEPEVEEPGGNNLWNDIYGKEQSRSRLCRQAALSELRGGSKTEQACQKKAMQKSIDSVDEFGYCNDDCVQLFIEPTEEELPLPKATPLGERSSNIQASTPSPSRKYETSPAKSTAISRPPSYLALSSRPTKPTNSAGGLSHANIIHIADTPPLDSLHVQAEQPTTPRTRASKAIGNVRGRTPRSIGGSKMESARKEGAAARVAARRKNKAQLKMGGLATPRP